MLVQQQNNKPLKKYWGINNTLSTGKYENARQFFSDAMPFCQSCLTVATLIFALIHSSHHSLCVFALLACYLHSYSSSLLAIASSRWECDHASQFHVCYCLLFFLLTVFNRHYSLSSFAVCMHALVWVERALACVRIQTHRSHTRACYLICDLYCKLCTESRRQQ